MATVHTYRGPGLDALRRTVSSKPRVALVNNICPHYRRPLFELLARRFELECFFFASTEPYWNPLLPTFDTGDFVEVDLPRRSVLGEPVMPALARRLTRSRYDAVVMGLAGRLMLPYVFATARVRRLPFVLWTGTWHHPRTTFHRATRGLTEGVYRHSDAIVVYGDHVRRALHAVRGVDDAKIFTQIVNGGADEITDVFDDEQIERVEIELSQGAGDHFGLQVADGPGCDLNHRNTCRTQAGRIVVCGEVTDNDAQAQL